jgi:hypothetical protein
MRRLAIIISIILFTLVLSQGLFGTNIVSADPPLPPKCKGCE